MEIDKTGMTLLHLQDVLDSIELKLQAKYGSTFHIKPEGIIDNLATVVGFFEMSLQKQVAFLVKQLDPETAEGIWQDYLYERIGLHRIGPRKTVIEKNVISAPNVEIEAGKILVRNTVTDDEFLNISAVITDENGFAKIDFECVLFGDVTVTNDDEFVIVSAPDSLKSLQTPDNAKISIGRYRESNEEFRIRFRKSKSITAKATEDANRANLLPFVDNEEYLQIWSKDSDLSMEPGTLHIIAKHNTTNKIFATAIMNTIAGGIWTLGSESVLVQDKSGKWKNIKFTNAKEVKIYIQADLKVKYGSYYASTSAMVKQNIAEYTKKRIFGLNSKIYPSEFYIPSVQTNGVEDIRNIRVKREDETDYTDFVALAPDEVAVFNIEWITLNESS